MFFRNIVILFFLCFVSFGQAQDSLLTEAPKSASDASISTRRNARTLTLTIPAPRGQITDRYGKSLAQTRVVYHLALQFPHLEDSSEEVVLEWARKRIARADELTGREYQVKDRTILAHYRDRRWIPLVVSTWFRADRQPNLQKYGMSGLVLHPIYMRYYPEKDLAAHVVGYVRSTGKLPKGPINYGDPLFESSYGAAGLENTFDAFLQGKDGKRKLVYDSDGSKLLDEIIERPQTGGNVVTSLNLSWQKAAEATLKSFCKKGALVVIDIETGEILTLASRPSFDLNVWIPSISQKDLDKLNDNESKPMYARAFQATYPPASTFKAIIAASALSNNVVTKKTKIDCPAKIKIGSKWFNNHSKIPAGPINVHTAMVRSNNVWFYKVGIDLGSDRFLATARRFGFGMKTNVGLFSEGKGLIPSDQWMRKHYKRHIATGDTANLAIGQGVLLSSPLQLCQAMAGVGNGAVLPKLHLIRQIQNRRGQVVQAAKPKVRNRLGVTEKSLKVVRNAMFDVVHASNGTGKKASLSYTSVCGKTGTAQWVGSQNLAWFAGFLPYDNPRFAFVALREGSKGQSLSGGKHAAPMVRSFFERIKVDMKRALKPAPAALVVEDIPEESFTPFESDDTQNILRALPVEEAQELVVPAENPPVEQPSLLIPGEGAGSGPGPVIPGERSQGAEAE